jgi:hypothetical protein
MVPNSPPRTGSLGRSSSIVTAQHATGPVHLFLDICQGLGLALAVGVRPFLPALLAGALAAGDLGLDYDHTSYSFLEDAGFLFLMVAGVVVTIALARYLGERRAALFAVAAGIALGALEFAGSLADRHDVSWYGLPAGGAAAVLAAAATFPLLSRAAARLDAAARATLPLYAEGGALALAGLSILIPPVSLVALAGAIWLILAGRRRTERKYAGLRILR